MSTTVVPVPLPGREYDIHIGSGLLPRAGELLQSILRGKQVLLAMDANVVSPHGVILRGALEAAGYTVEIAEIPAGEQSKNTEQLARLWDALAGARFGRDAAVVALGGGVAGDLVGFAAASYMRGIDFVQIPTTLLAMVDSSVGGKTGINHPVAKNLIGAFWQPRVVIADTATLRTLPQGERISALAEIIKYGVIFDAEFFAWLEDNIPELVDMEQDALSHAIRRSCEIKAEVVLHDERESGLRKILNFGHTLGHAIENSAGYGVIRHGEAIAIGMVAESLLQANRHDSSWTDNEHRRLARLLSRAGLPTTLPAGLPLEVKTLMAAARSDKKNRAGAIRYALPTKLGCMEDVSATEGEAAEVLRAIGART